MRINDIPDHSKVESYACHYFLIVTLFCVWAVDGDLLTSLYPDMFTLMEHLEGMGENNAARARRAFVSRDVFTAAASAYHALYANKDGLIPATFNVGLQSISYP